MKYDIRNLFKEDMLQKKKLPNSHREEFIEKLQDQKKSNPKNKNLGLVFKIAASIVLLLGLTFFIKKDKKTLPVKTNELVNQPIDTTIFKQEKLFKNTLTKESIVLENEALIKTKVSTKAERYLKNNSFKKEQPIITNKEIGFQENEQKIAITNTTINKENNIEIVENNNKLTTIKKDSKLQIKVNSNALLYSVTHSKNEVLAYYKANNLTRESVIASIEDELINSKLNIDANELLTEIELGLKAHTFKEKLLAKIKLKIKELSNAIATN